MRLRFDRWTLVTVMAVGFTLALVARLFFGVGPPGYSPANAQAKIIDIRRAEGDPWADDMLLDAMTGSVLPSNRTVAAASCASRADWLDDVTLDGWVLVATDPGLILAAEAHGSQATTIERVERKFWELGGDLDAVMSWAATLDDADEQARISEYLDERATAPTRSAIDRYTVYASSTALTRQMIVYLDRDRAQPDQVERNVGGPTDGRVMVAGEDTGFRLDNRDCALYARQFRRL